MLTGDSQHLAKALLDNGLSSLAVAALSHDKDETSQTMLNLIKENHPDMVENVTKELKTDKVGPGQPKVVNIENGELQGDWPFKEVGEAAFSLPKKDSVAVVKNPLLSMTVKEKEQVKEEVKVDSKAWGLEDEDEEEDAEQVVTTEKSKQLVKTEDKPQVI